MGVRNVVTRRRRDILEEDVECEEEYLPVLFPPVAMVVLFEYLVEADVPVLFAAAPAEEEEDFLEVEVEGILK